MQKDKIPTSPEEIKEIGWNFLDVLLITGDVFVDHPSFGVAVIARVLTERGFKTAVLSQPDINKEEISEFPIPQFFYGVTSGNLDSMVSNYTASRKPRRTDDYSFDSVSGKRPDRAVISYTNYVKKHSKNIPVILGGIEASLRRFAHYDWWQNKVRHSVLLDSKAEFLLYGMAEKSLWALSDFLKGEIGFDRLKETPGVVFATSNYSEIPKDAIELPSFEKVSAEKTEYAKAFKLFYEENDPIRGKTLFQRDGNRFVVQNPPSLPLSEQEMDRVYSLPFTREIMYHEGNGTLKAFETIKNSITSHRGCYGECAFCSISVHQGRYISSRSKKSIIEEVRKISKSEEFKGYISDVGGPTANMYGFDCEVKKKSGSCRDRKCVSPSICSSLKVDHSAYISLLRELIKIRGIKGVFISSGIRYDLILKDTKAGNEFLKTLCANHVSGQLKVAPEHSEDKVLKLMGKPQISVFLDFKRKFEEESRKIGKKQFIVAYFITGHPGETSKENEGLKAFIKRNLGYYPQQIQIFTPTPSTLSTTIYFSGINPFNGEKVFVETSDKMRNELKKNLFTFQEEKKNAVYESFSKGKKGKRSYPDKGSGSGRLRRK